MTVSDDKIQITLLILSRGAFSSPAALWDHVAEFAEFTLPLSWGEGGSADCLIILRRYLQAVLPSREGEKVHRGMEEKEESVRERYQVLKPAGSNFVFLPAAASPAAKWSPVTSRSRGTEDVC